jgi:hypothetical protein
MNTGSFIRTIQPTLSKKNNWIVLKCRSSFILVQTTKAPQISKGNIIIIETSLSSPVLLHFTRAKLCSISDLRPNILSNLVCVRKDSLSILLLLCTEQICFAEMRSITDGWI